MSKRSEFLDHVAECVICSSANRIEDYCADGKELLLEATNEG